MKPARWGDENYEPYYQQCQKALNYAIIDEVDNILIDEARTPLIISGQRSATCAATPRQRHRCAAGRAAKEGTRQVFRDQGEGSTPAT